MKNLPSIQKQNIKIAKQTFLLSGRLEIYEPCDCGGQIRHNNGGNYHEEIELLADDDGVFIRYGSSSEWDKAEWEQCDDWEAVIESHAEWL